FERVLAVRAAVTKAIEEARQGGTVKQASEARVVLDPAAVDGLAPLLHARVAELPAVFLAAEVVIKSAPNATESPVLSGLRVAVERADGDKCPRCWMVRPLGGDPRHPELCSRCAAVLG